MEREHTQIAARDEHVVNPTAPPPRRRRGQERRTALLLLAPSVILSLVFVYGFILATGYISLSSWSTPAVDLSIREPVGSVYRELANTPRFQADVRNTIILTTLVLFVTVAGGMGLALLLDRARERRSSAWFRQVFLFPYSLSFIVTGVVWRWIFNPETGINLLFDVTGFNRILEAAGIGPLHPGWLTDPRVVLSVNDALARVFPGAASLQTLLGIPLALIPIVIASAWQLSGFAMAMYLAGLGSISEDTREAARIDGCSETQLYRWVIVPQLRPMTVAVLTIVGATTLKVFDLIVGMSGVGPGFATDVLGLFVYDTTFRASRFNAGAAASVVMLILVALVIVPYLARSTADQ
jgi:glucose/mannose transport system permease protein